ncbi:MULTISPECIES: ATP-dependent nuclease [Comamonas]|uniref:ATP-dependent nuclease n=1 Tax=Comamonas TaxID=283 RepID=UPI001CE0BC11|nr:MULTISPECIES: TOPRIM nucleotidyl transferase/hydrolase domain-containing protein [Comamonas]MDH1503162.1 AAA family ATPase [Comamonas terrigena]
MELRGYAGNLNEEALAGAWQIANDRARLMYRFRPRSSLRERLASGDPTVGALVLDDYQWELVGGGDPGIDLATISWDEDVGQSIRFPDLQAFQVVFLPALRDVENDLRQPRLSPFVKLIEAIKISDEEKSSLVNALAVANDTISSSKTIKDIAIRIDKAYEEVAGPAFEMTITAGLAEPSFSSVVRALRLLLSDEFVIDVEPSSNGLGVNNILYIAILVEYFRIRLAREVSAGQLILFEEPEAHLHPQLQLSLYAALEQLPFQTILTTHSTHITAQAGLRNFIALTNQGTGTSHSSVPARAKAFCADDVADLERYLDATKSSLLFARKVMLVEGPAEMLLIPALVKKVLGRNLDREGVAVIPIYGVHFDVYAKLFSEEGLPKKCAIVADGDLSPSDAIWSALGDEEAPLEQLEIEALENEYVKVFRNATTFERAITMQGNLEMFALAAEQLGAARIARSLRAADARLQKAPNLRARNAIGEEVRGKVLNTAKRYGKGRFAQVCARNVHQANALPKYIKDALDWLD